MRWRLVSPCDPVGRALADRHYSRQTPGSRRFVPPGRCVVLVSLCGRAVWATVQQRHVRHQWPGAWMCSIFRNEGAGMSSELVAEALAATVAKWGPAPSPDL